jgi:hypothetical protein
MVKKQNAPCEDYVKCNHCDAYVKNTARSKGAHIGYFHKEIAVELYRQPSKFSIKCLECDQLVANSKNVLGRHVRKIHMLTYEHYVIKYEMNGIRPTCACGCGARVVFRKGGFDKFASKSCAALGDRNPMSKAQRPINPNTGKVRTEEHKMKYREAAKIRWEGSAGNKMRELMKGEEYSKKQSEAQKVVYTTTNHAEKVSKGINRFWSSDDPRVEQLREQASDRACDLLSQNKIGPHAPFKCEWIFNPFTDKEEYMHSSYETEFLRRCIEAGVPTTKEHQIRIPYVNVNGKPAKYIPDFVMYHLREVHEVKGKMDDDAAGTGAPFHPESDPAA